MSGWPKYPLRDLAADIFVGIPAPGRGQSGASAGFVSIGNIREGELVPSVDTDLHCLNETERRERYVLRPGDVLLTARGTTMKIALVRDNAGYTANNTLMVVRAGEKASGEFLHAALLSAPLQQALMSVTRGSTSILSWRVQDVAALEIPLPPSAIRTDLAALVDAEIRHYNLSRAAADARRSAVRAALAVRLFTDVELS